MMILKHGRKAIINDGLHGLPDGSEIVFIGVDYEDDEMFYVFRSERGMLHYLTQEEFNWSDTVEK